MAHDRFGLILWGFCSGLVRMSFGKMDVYTNNVGRKVKGNANEGLYFVFMIHWSLTSIEMLLLLVFVFIWNKKYHLSVLQK